MIQNNDLEEASVPSFAESEVGHWSTVLNCAEIDCRVDWYETLILATCDVKRLLISTMTSLNDAILVSANEMSRKALSEP